LKVKVTDRSALVRVAASGQQITAHAGLVLVRELWDRLGLPPLLDAVTVKKRRRGYSAPQAVLAVCETLIVGGECLDDATLLRGDGGQEQLRGHAVPDPTTLGRFLARFNLGHIGQLNRAFERLFARVHPLLVRGEQVTLDLDSTLVEHHGPVGSRQGTRGTYAGKVAWHPLLCFVAETGEWLHGKLRNGHAAPSTGARRFFRECLRRLPDGIRVFLRADERGDHDDVEAELSPELAEPGRDAAYPFAVAVDELFRLPEVPGGSRTHDPSMRRSEAEAIPRCRHNKSRRELSRYYGVSKGRNRSSSGQVHPQTAAEFALLHGRPSVLAVPGYR
jgi:hypothetical protein